MAFITPVGRRRTQSSASAKARSTGSTAEVASSARADRASSIACRAKLTAIERGTDSGSCAASRSTEGKERSVTNRDYRDRYRELMVIPRPASTVVLIRRAPKLEVLLGLRPPGGVFGDIWAFPGGAVDGDDSDVLRWGFSDRWRAAALREMAEEVGVFLTKPRELSLDVDLVPDTEQDVVAMASAAGMQFDPGRLQYLSNWVTPPGMPRRFDTRFFLAEVTDAVRVRARTGEFDDLEWVDPGIALRQHRAGERPMMQPTTWHLRRLVDTTDPWRLPEHPIQMPRMVNGLPVFDEAEHAELVIGEFNDGEHRS